MSLEVVDSLKLHSIQRQWEESTFQVARKIGLFWIQTASIYLTGSVE